MFLDFLEVYRPFLLFQVLEDVVIAFLLLDLGAVVSFLAFFEEWLA